jgi:mannose-6-phosphate isomerase-like protein (cupin superfamily)
MTFETSRIGDAPDVIALDGSEVRLLCGVSRGALSVFSLPAHAVARAVAHRTIEEVWYFVSGHGRMWRRLGEREEIVEVSAGIALTIPTATQFQFRSDSAEPLSAVAAVMPPWPGEAEVHVVDGPWSPTV